MRKHIALLALLVSGFFMLSAGSGTASAANCSPQFGMTYYGYYGANLATQFSARLNCNGVDRVQYDGWGGPAIANGWSDYTEWSFHWAQNSVTERYVTITQQVGLVGYVTQNYFQNGCWWNGHRLGKSFGFRIHNYAQNSWGGWANVNQQEYSFFFC